MKIAMIQMHVVADKNQNLCQAAGSIARAAAMGADLAVLPEMFNCPYVAASFPEYAEAQGGQSWRAMSDAAREHGIFLAAGSMPEAEGGRVYNTAYVFGPDGAQLAKHRKVHLFDIDVTGGQRFRESDTLSPGDRATVFETPFCKVGLAVCYDIRFPELSRLMALDGARVLIFPGAFNMTTGPAHWELNFRSRALDNQVFTVGVSPARDEGAAYVSYANSIAVSPWGDVLCRMDAGEGIALAEIDLDRVAQVRAQLPLLRHRRPELYEHNRK